MKKTLLIIVSIAMLVSVFGCSKNTAQSVEAPKPVENNNQVAAVVTPTLAVTANNPVKEVSLSNEELKNMNIFFSNFFEAYFDSYNGNTDDEKLIKFSILHNKINYGKRFSYVQGSDGRTYAKIDGNYVADRIQRFFGKNITLKSTDYYSYRDGAFYSQAASGEAYNRFAQVTTECFDNGDGTLSVLIAKYVCNDGVDINDKMYEPAKTWNANLQNQCKFEGLYQTKIKRVNFDGKNTYQLLEMYPNNNQKTIASSAEKPSQNSTVTVEQAQMIVENYFKSQNYNISSVTHMPGKDTGAQATKFYCFRVGQSTKEAPNLSFHVYVADNTGKIHDENLSPIN